MLPEWVRGTIYLIAAHSLRGVFCQNSSTTQSTTGDGVSGDDTTNNSKSFPVWQIGVIIISGIVVLVAVGTIIQRLLRRRANHNDRYRMTS